MSHETGGPVDCDHDKHQQLGCELENDDREPVDDIDAVWADATTVEQFKLDIEELAREARKGGM